MKYIKKVVLKMKKYILGYSARSILGRAVYTPRKNTFTPRKTSILGTTVYGEQKYERNNLCHKLLKKFQK